MNLQLKEQEVVGQESNQATFRNLNSSHHYVVRLRVRSPALGHKWHKRLRDTNPTYLLQVEFTCTISIDFMGH